MTLNELTRKLIELEADLKQTDLDGELSEQIRLDVLGTLVLCRLNLACSVGVDRIQTVGFARKQIGRRTAN